MIEIKDDIWKYKDQGYIVIPTNGYVKGNGQCVMGRGLAFQCAHRYPSIPLALGHQICATGNHVYEFVHPLKMFSFPVKHNWWEKADYQLIERSVKELRTIVGIRQDKIFIPHVGCGNGQLNWPEVYQLIAGLDQRFMVVDR